MRLLRFLSRVAFICNICFLLASLEQYLPKVPEGAVSTIIVMGYLMGIVINILVNFTLLVVWAFKKGALAVPAWLWIVNLIFLIIQLVILFVHI